MTAERQLKIARKIVLDGIEAEVKRLEPTVFRDMGLADERAVREMVAGIANGTQCVEFKPSFIDPAQFWVKPS